MILGSIQGLSDRKCIVHVKVYLPCALIVVLSWVGFWLNREATSDRVTLGNSLHSWLHIYPHSPALCFFTLSADHVIYSHLLRHK